MTEGRHPALELRDVTYAYGSEPLFEALTLEVEGGVFTGIIGPNGCGKSTLLKLASALVMPHAGEVVVGGRSLSTLSHRQRARIVSLMPQDLPKAPMAVKSLAMSGRYSHIGMLSAPTDVDRATVDEALSLTGIDDLRDRLVSSLSGGQRQRAFLAMALAQQTDVMLLDEPTSALDIGAAHDAMQLLRNVQQARQTSIIAVLHDLDLALRYCDRIVLMDAGTVAAIGAPDEIAESALLARVFNVRLHRADTPFGSAWTAFPQR